MDKYRLKGANVLVEAAQVSDDTIREIVRWTGGHQVEERDSISYAASAALNLRTPTGMARASNGQWVVKLGNFFHVIGPGAFELRYEKVEQPQETRHPESIPLVTNWRTP